MPESVLSFSALIIAAVSTGRPRPISHPLPIGHPRGRGEPSFLVVACSTSDNGHALLADGDVRKPQIYVNCDLPRSAKSLVLRLRS